MCLVCILNSPVGHRISWLWTFIMLDFISIFSLGTSLRLSGHGVALFGSECRGVLSPVEDIY